MNQQYSMKRSKWNMKKARTLSVIAGDDDLCVEINVTITPRKGYPLEKYEMDALVKQCGRRIGQVLPELPYSDFGIDNTRIENH
jgi:hypothetical protein